MSKFRGSFIGCLLSISLLGILLGDDHHIFAQPHIVGEFPSEQQLTPLQMKEKRLLAELKNLNPAAPDTSLLSSMIMKELQEVQQQMQQNSLPATVASSGSLPGDSPFAGGMMGSGMVLPTRPGFDNAPFYQQIHDDLTFQLRQIQQTIKMLQPQDQNLAQMLKEQQAGLISQLQQIKQQMGTSETSSTPLPNTLAEMIPLGMGQGGFPEQRPMLPVNSESLGVEASLMGSALQQIAPAVPPVNTSQDQRSVKMEQAAKLLREVGLEQLAIQVSLFADQPLPEGGPAPFSWAGDGGKLNSLGHNPFAVEPSAELAELKRNTEELNMKIDKLASELANVNTQLKLISHKIVTERIHGLPE